MPFVSKINHHPSFNANIFGINGLISYFCVMDLDEAFKYVSGKAGMRLCVAGSRKLLINGHLYEVSRGFLYVQSPIVSVLELSQDDDYKEVSIIDDTSVFFQSIRGIIDTLIKCRMRESPCMQLSETNIHKFIEQHNKIDAKRRYAATLTDKNEIGLVIRSIHLIEQLVMIDFLHQYYIGHHLSHTPTSKNETILIKFILSLHTNAKNERSVVYYANEAGLSPNHFSRIIRKQTGEPPSQLIAIVIIAKAKLLLRQPDLNIKDVAAKLNFPEQYTFRKYFKLHVGMSPKEFRQQEHKSK